MAFFIHSGQIQPPKSKWSSLPSEACPASTLRFMSTCGVLTDSGEISLHTQNTTGTLGELGVCQCPVVLPDSTFPVDRFEKLVTSNQNLTIIIDQQITKVKSTLNTYMERLANLTKLVGVIKMGSIVYIDLDFQLVRSEIKAMEALILQLKTLMNGTNAGLESLYLEIPNFSTMVNQLEVYDKNNTLMIIKEIASLKWQLETCTNQTNSVPSPPQLNKGTCLYGYIMNISKPSVVQLNYLGTGYKYGGWGRDSMAGADQNVHWVAPLSTDKRTMNSLRTYNTSNDLVLYKHALDRNFTSENYGQGGGMIMFNKTMYYNCYDRAHIRKYNPELDKFEPSVLLPNAGYNNRFPYSSSYWQDIDIASDEEGLWVIYSTENYAGNITISKLDPVSLAVKQTWLTGQYKQAASNAFMACGVLYVTRALSTEKEEIFYMYDTKTKKEGSLRIPLEKPKETVQSLSYNANDRKLYMYNDGYLVTYNIIFTPPQ
ncbi:olfactomedin-4-like [Dendropsophus ebraccatus]|uniref:olfactomedin-4-like n=1 Tax=Dendropsophus ebraccatus TaxID=150705 RepID=UPI003830FF7B